LFPTWFHWLALLVQSASGNTDVQCRGRIQGPARLLHAGCQSTISKDLARKIPITTNVTSSCSTVQCRVGLQPGRPRPYLDPPLTCLIFQVLRCVSADIIEIKARRCTTWTVCWTLSCSPSYQGCAFHTHAALRRTARLWSQHVVRLAVHQDQNLGLCFRIDWAEAMTKFCRQCWPWFQTAYGRVTCGKVIDDANTFGQEWQVLDTEPSSLHGSSPQHPTRCAPFLLPCRQASSAVASWKRRSISLLQKRLASTGAGQGWCVSRAWQRPRNGRGGAKKVEEGCEWPSAYGHFLLHYDWFAVTWIADDRRRESHYIDLLHIIQRQGTRGETSLQAHNFEKTKTGFGQYSTFIDYSTTLHILDAKRCGREKLGTALDEALLRRVLRTGLVQD
jgi:hypothetical protein